MNYLFKNLILVIFMILVALSIGNVDAADCERHPIYCHIKQVKPNISSTKAMGLSNLFHKYAKKYNNKNPIISVAIARQEASFNTNKSRSQNIIVFSKDMTDWEVIRGYSDICMFQFHVNTILSEGLDPIKLKLDLRYCIEQHFKFLKKKMKICRHLGADSWTCYHSTTPKLRKRYKEDVEQWL